MVFNKKLTIYLILSSTLFLGFFFRENSSGGAKIDYEYLLPYIKNFTISFSSGLEVFLNNSGSIIHSPIFYILMSLLLRIFGDISILKIIYLLFSLSLPYFFFIILKEKFKTNYSYIFYISLIIFLSPYFRSSAIWLLGDNLSLIFFSLSIFFFLHFDQNKKNNKLIFISLTFFVACSYIRYYYCVFFIYYLYYYYKNLSRELLLRILTFSFFLSLPAISYFSYIVIEFEFLKTLESFGKIDYLNSGIIVLTIILFYLLPFLIDKEFKVLNYYKKKTKIIFIYLSAFLIICLIDYFFITDFVYFSQKGGGVFLKFFRFFGVNETLPMLFLALISLLILDFIFKEDRVSNYLILFALIISLPMLTIYQKYLDPLFFLIFFGLIKSDYISYNIIKKNFNLKLIFSYFSFFYLLSLFYYLD
tara:strand:- start:3822 stop:5075 length:1254 start_codon:yes stop_codon:yes gene_type:complete